MGGEGGGSGEDGGGAVGGDFPDEISGGVGYVSVSLVINRHVVGDRGDVFGIGEWGEEDTAAIAEIVGGEGVERLGRVDRSEDTSISFINRYAEED